ncbi:hypothetical protein M2158_008758 [Streptomyces sp. SAI-144]|nr:hypothetical protein [Streptomyces sp. SAI-144]
MSRETDSPSSGPNGRGGAAYPSGTPPYGTPQVSDGGPDAGRSAAQPEERKTETTLTTRIRINIPGSRPIPPVVVRQPVGETENSGDRGQDTQASAPSPSSTTGTVELPADPAPPAADEKASDWFAPRKSGPAKGGPGEGASNGAGLPGGSGAAAPVAGAPGGAGPGAGASGGGRHGAGRPGGVVGSMSVPGGSRSGGTNGAGLPGATGGPVAPGHGGGTGSFDVTEALNAGPRGTEPRRDDLPYFAENGSGGQDSPNGQGGFGGQNGQSGHDALNGHGGFGGPGGQDSPNGQGGFGGQNGQSGHDALNGHGGFGGPGGHDGPNGQGGFGGQNGQSGHDALNGHGGFGGHDGPNGQSGFGAQGGPGSAPGGQNGQIDYGGQGGQIDYGGGFGGPKGPGGPGGPQGPAGPTGGPVTGDGPVVPPAGPDPFAGAESFGGESFNGPDGFGGQGGPGGPGGPGAARGPGGPGASRGPGGTRGPGAPGASGGPGTLGGPGISGGIAGPGAPGISGGQAGPGTLGRPGGPGAPTPGGVPGAGLGPGGGLSDDTAILTPQKPAPERGAPGFGNPDNVSGHTVTSGIPVVPPGAQKAPFGPGTDGRTPPKPDTASQEAPAAAPKKKKKKGRSKVALLGGTVVLLGVGAYGAGLLMNRSDVPKGTTVLGVDIGGGTRDDAVKKLDDALGGRVNEALKLSVGGDTVSLKPDQAGLQLDDQATVAAAAKSDYNPISVIGSLFGNHRVVDPVMPVDEEKLQAALQDASGGAGSATDGTIKFENGKAVAVYGKAGKGIDVARSTTAVEDAYRTQVETGTAGSVTLPTTTKQPSVSNAEVDRMMKEFAEPAMSNVVTVQTDAAHSIPFGALSLPKILGFKAVDGKLVETYNLEALKAAYGNTFDGVQINGASGKRDVLPQDVASALGKALRGKTTAERTAVIDTNPS